MIIRVIFRFNHHLHTPFRSGWLAHPSDFLANREFALVWTFWVLLVAFDQILAVAEATRWPCCTLWNWFITERFTPVLSSQFALVAIVHRCTPFRAHIGILFTLLRAHFKHFHGSCGGGGGDKRFNNQVSANGGSRFQSGSSSG